MRALSAIWNLTPHPPVPRVMPLGMFLKSGSSAGEEGAEGAQLQLG